MSVAFHYLKSEIVFLGGRAEALWMKDHLPCDDINESYTKFYIDEDNIRKAVRDAREYIKSKSLPFEFETWMGETDKEEMLKEHRRITRELPKTLREMLAKVRAKTKGSKRKYPYFEIEVGW